MWTITTTQPCKRKNLTWPTKTGLWRLARSRRTSFEIVARSIEEVSQSQKEASLRQAPMSTSLKLNEERCSINSLPMTRPTKTFSMWRCMPLGCPKSHPSAALPPGGEARLCPSVPKCYFKRRCFLYGYAYGFLVKENSPILCVAERGRGTTRLSCLSPLTNSKILGKTFGIRVLRCQRLGECLRLPRAPPTKCDKT